MSVDKLLAAETVEVQEEVCTYQLEFTLVKKTKQEVLKKSFFFSIDLSIANTKEAKKATFENITPPPPPAPSTSSSSSLPPSKSSDLN